MLETAELAADVRRVADRLRSLSQARLAAALPPHPSRAAAARAVAQVLADAAQGIEERTAAGEPTWRVVPELSDFAVGDQLAVTGHDLLAAADGLPVDAQVWTRAGRRPVGEVVGDAAGRLAELRRAL